MFSSEDMTTTRTGKIRSQSCVSAASFTQVGFYKPHSDLHFRCGTRTIYFLESHQ